MAQRWGGQESPDSARDSDEHVGNHFVGVRSQREKQLGILIKKVSDIND